MTTITVASPQYLNLNVSDGSSDVNLAVTLPSDITLAVDVGQGPSGPQGIQGNSITNIARTSGTGAAGTTDTYTIYYSDNTTDTFQLYNGQNGNYIYEGVPVVQQTDIGTEPNEIPLNQYLGSLAYEDAENVSISGGAINNTTIGATTRAAGNFTTLDANGNVILGDTSTDTVTVNGYMGVGGAGAANTPLRLTSTATGSSTQIGIYSAVTGDSSAVTALDGFRSLVSTAAASFTLGDLSGFRVNNASKGAGSTINNQHGLYITDLTSGTNNYGITSAVSSGTNKWNIYASGTAANYFAGDLRINTTAAFGSEKLSVGGEIFVDAAPGSNGVNSTTYSWLTGVSGDPAYPASIKIEQGTSSTRHGMSFWTSNAAIPVERMRIDPAGNLGLGVVPSAWGGGYIALDIASRTALVAGGSADPSLVYNGYYNGTNWIYKAATYASRYQQILGEHRWYTAPSGTAGNAISFTEALTLNADGKLLIGTTTAGASKLTVNDDSIQINTAKTPASATDTGTAGQVAWDANYVYVCVATNTWKRSALSTW